MGCPVTQTERLSTLLAALLLALAVVAASQGAEWWWIPALPAPAVAGYLWQKWIGK